MVISKPSCVQYRTPDLKTKNDNCLSDILCENGNPDLVCTFYHLQVRYYLLLYYNIMHKHYLCTMHRTIIISTFVPVPFTLLLLYEGVYTCLLYLRNYNLVVTNLTVIRLWLPLSNPRILFASPPTLSVA